ncbi:FMN-binding protein [Micromonospora sp. NPDC051300]|uniref:FMN-binding protein n=1 Tax=Micromonospora sp. NPDC051300 TaxID=3364286 RepID=UPI0037A4B32B
MRRITIWLLSTVAALVLLFSYRTSTMGAGGETGAVATGSDPGGGTWSGADGGPDASGGGTGSSTGSGSGTTGGGSSTGGDGSTTGGSGTATGSVAQTRWGPVQVRITVAAGKITDVTAVQVPDGNRRDQEINDYAVPILRQEALAAQSARIDSVSGATVTSDGYRESLQSAIDAAHLR